MIIDKYNIKDIVIPGFKNYEDENKKCYLYVQY